MLNHVTTVWERFQYQVFTQLRKAPSMVILYVKSPQRWNPQITAALLKPCFWKAFPWRAEMLFLTGSELPK